MGTWDSRATHWIPCLHLWAWRSWYGYVTPDDVPELIEQHIGQGRIIDQLLRGQMGLTEDDQKEWLQERTAAGSTADNEVQRECAFAEVQAQGAKNGTVHQNGSVSQDKKSCQKCSPILLPHIGSCDLHKMCGDAEAEDAAVLSCPLPKDNKSWLGKFFKMPRWTEDWEADDTKLSWLLLGLPHVSSLPITSAVPLPTSSE